MRRKVIVIGIVAATVMRIVFALITTQLLRDHRAAARGGLLLLWVCWKMCAGAPRSARRGTSRGEALANDDLNADGTIGARRRPRKTLRQAVIQIVIADVSMSLDNVLAVAGAARDHPTVLIFGLALSVALMGRRRLVIARLLNRYRWIAWIGLARHPLRRGPHDLRGLARRARCRARDAAGRDRGTGALSVGSRGPRASRGSPRSERGPTASRGSGSRRRYRR